MKLFINFLTYSRILAGPILFCLIFAEEFFICLILFILAGLTDYFDGFLARKHNLTSQLGEILDPVADKILIVFMFIGLSIYLDSFFLGICSSFILMREFLISALRESNARNFKTNATKVTFLAKTKTSVQLFTIAIFLTGLIFDYALIMFMGNFFIFLAMLITIYTGLQYFLNSYYVTNDQEI